MGADPLEVLWEVLEAENAALRAADLGRAGKMLEPKQRAVAALGASVPKSAEVAERLRRAAEENRQLLEHAIRVQGRVVAIVAQAASRATARGQYAAGVIRGHRGAAAPVALVARV